MPGVPVAQRPADMVDTIQGLLRLAAARQTADALSEAGIDAAFEPLPSPLQPFARHLLGSAVQHADDRTGELPPKVLANMHRLVELQVTKGAALNNNPKGAAAGAAAAACAPTASEEGGAVVGSHEHTPTFTNLVRAPGGGSDDGTSSGSEDGNASEGGGAFAELQVRAVELDARVFVQAGARKQPQGHYKRKKGKAPSKAKAMHKTVAEVSPGIALALKARGCAICDRFLPVDVVEAVREEIARLEPHYKASEIWVGKDSDIGAQITVPRVRGDKVLWVDRGSIERSKMTAVREMLDALDRLVLHELATRVERLRDVAGRTDPMLAIYPGGGTRFQKHIDNTARDGRRLTVLCYLNPEWRVEHGGSLRVHEDALALDVQPQAGRVAMFYSDTSAHEVLPSHACRHAVTVWYYDRDERAEALAKAPKAPTDNDATVRSRHEARAFLLWILAHESAPTQETVNAIVQRAHKLSPQAVAIVAGVTGAPSTDDFMHALTLLTPDSLLKLRSDLSEMGIGNVD